MVYSAALLCRKICGGRGSNSISNFHFHNINEGPADLHYVTGRSFAFSGLLKVLPCLYGQNDGANWRILYYPTDSLVGFVCNMFRSLRQHIESSSGSGYPAPSLQTVFSYGWRGILLRGIQLTLVQRYRGSTVKMVLSYKIFTFYEVNTLMAFGARTFLVLSQQ
jgi:hypothetical protein